MYCTFVGQAPNSMFKILLHEHQWTATHLDYYLFEDLLRTHYMKLTLHVYNAKKKLLHKINANFPKVWHFTKIKRQLTHFNSQNGKAILRVVVSRISLLHFLETFLWWSTGQCTFPCTCIATDLGSINIQAHDRLRVLYSLMSLSKHTCFKMRIQVEEKC